MSLYFALLLLTNLINGSDDAVTIGCLDRIRSLRSKPKSTPDKQIKTINVDRMKDRGMSEFNLNEGYNSVMPDPLSPVPSIGGSPMLFTKTPPITPPIVPISSPKRQIPPMSPSHSYSGKRNPRLIDISSVPSSPIHLMSTSSNPLDKSLDNHMEKSYILRSIKRNAFEEYKSAKTKSSVDSVMTVRNSEDRAAQDDIPMDQMRNLPLPGSIAQD